MLAVQHLGLLQKSKEQSHGSLSIASIAGLDVQTWQAILQTSLLWHWKVEQIGSRSLSYRELVRRAMSIEDSFLAQQRAASVLLANDPRASSLSRNSAIMNNIFASAALVYLRTVVSGPNPDVPDIKVAVDTTMEAIQLTSDPAILCRMSWPVCVAASMATKTKRGFWNKLFNGSKASSTAVKEGDGFTRVMKLVEKCWYMRDKGAIVDWSDAAKNMDTTLLML